MRILYVYPESPLFTDGGGAATYLGYMAKAMRDAGHEVFLFTWRDSDSRTKPRYIDPFFADNVHIEKFSRNKLVNSLPVFSADLSISIWLKDRIAHHASEWNIDVVETSDFYAPCLDYFQSVQSSYEGKSRLCVTYHHGFIEDIYEASQLHVPIHAQLNQLGERQQCRSSDLVIAPSVTAMKRLATYGIKDNVFQSREPYVFDTSARALAPRPTATYMGRISIQKGIDKLIHFLNVTKDIFPYDNINLTGRLEHTPFRKNDMRQYITDRLHPDLRSQLNFLGHRPREQAVAMLGAGEISPHLGSLETFSYSCIEAIDRGCFVVAREGTAMAEFYPPDLRWCLLDTRMMQVSEIQSRFERLLADGSMIFSQVESFCQEDLAPLRLANEMTDKLDSALRKKKGTTSIALGSRYGIDDVTILIPAYKPSAEFAETVDSLANQDCGQPRILICDDGTPDEDKAWFDYALCRLNNVEIISQPNTGLLGARNTLIEACKSEFSIFLDVDDIITENYISSALNAVNNSSKKVDAVIPRRANFYDSSELVARHLLDDHLHFVQNDFRMTALVRTEALKSILFDATRRNGEGDDWPFWLEFHMMGFVGIGLPEFNFVYRVKSGSMSHPWSQGQHTGTRSMLKDVISRYADSSPELLVQIVRAQYAESVRIAH